MLMLPREKKEGEDDYVWKSRYFDRRLSGLGCVIRWQKVYRGLPYVSVGTHQPDEAKMYADIGFGISINIIGFHVFLGLLFESHGSQAPQKGSDEK